MQISADGYIAAVRHALEADETIVLDHHVDGHGDMRRARIELDVDQDDIAFTDLESLTLGWDDEHGWWLDIIYEPDVGLAPPPIHRGIDVVPTPEVVTAWVGTVLTHPEIIASRDDGPLRHAGTVEGIEHALQRYSAPAEPH